LASLPELLVLAIVQGITEWLPISSKTNVMLAGLLFSLPFSRAYQLGLALNAATAFSSGIYFRKELASLLRSVFRGRGGIVNYDRPMALKIILATVTTGIVGVPLFVYFLAASAALKPSLIMTLTGVLLVATIFTAKLLRITMHGTRATPGYVEMMAVGATQGLAVLPGVSRSGVTLAALLAMGVRPHDALRISFVLSIPASLGAAALVIVAGDASVLELKSLETLLMGFVAFTVGLLTIGILMKLGERAPTLIFGVFVGVLLIAEGLLI